MVEVIDKPTLNPALKSFWKTKADLRILKGGRASTKTWDAAGFAIFLASTYRVKFLCVRQFQNKISESVYAVLKIQIYRFGLQSEFDILKSVIRHRETGSEFHFYGIHRHVEEIKGFEGADICWIEEGEGLTREQHMIIEPTLRKEGSEIWLIYNPRLVTDYVESFVEDTEAGVLVRQINYDENPFLSETMLRKIERLKKSDPEEYEHVYLGIPKTNDESAVIKLGWVQASIDAHVKLGIEPLGEHVIGFDVADDGKDLCSQIYRHGIVALWGEHWKGQEDELLKSCKRVYAKAIESSSHIVYDSIGVGALAGGKFQEMNEERKEKNLQGDIQFSKFIAGGKVINPDDFYVKAAKERVTNAEFFSNLKSQAWWSTADRFRNTYNVIKNIEAGDTPEEAMEKEGVEVEDLISISSAMPGLQNLVKELSTPKRDFAKDGRVKVESKDDLAKRDIPSHNDADAFIQAYSPRKRKKKSFFNV